MSRMPYQYFCVCPLAGEAQFKSKSSQFLKRSDIFPSNLEGLQPNPKTPQTHILVCFSVSQKDINAFVTGALGVSNTFWWALDMSNNTMAYKSSSAEIPATGDYWDINLALDYRNLHRMYNAEA